MKAFFRVASSILWLILIGAGLATLVGMQLKLDQLMQFSYAILIIATSLSILLAVAGSIAAIFGKDVFWPTLNPITIALVFMGFSCLSLVDHISSFAVLSLAVLAGVGIAITFIQAVSVRRFIPILTVVALLISGQWPQLTMQLAAINGVCAGLLIAGFLKDRLISESQEFD